MNIRTNVTKPSLLRLSIAASILFLTGGAALADSNVTLTAAPTSTTLPDGQAVPMWGYTCTAPSGTAAPASTGASCTAMNGKAQLGTTWQPPLITVPGDQPLNITLINKLSFGANTVPTSLVIVGQVGGGLGTERATMPSPTHTAQGTTWPGTLGNKSFFTPPLQADRVRSFGTEVNVSDAAGKVLTWAKLSPGTYLIESGTEPSIQGPMGLYGVLVVTDPASAQAAYGAKFDQDVALLLSEIDPIQNTEVAQVVQNSGFNETTVWNGRVGKCGDVTVPATKHTCYPPAVNYSPLYYLVNGVAFDRTNAAASTQSILPKQADTSNARVTNGTVLLRFVNAGLRMHVPAVVGANMTLLAEDGNKLPGNNRVQSEVLLTAGKTYDVTIQPAVDAQPATYVPATYAVFDRALSLSTGNQRDGGMQAYISVSGGAAVGAGSSESASSALAKPDTYSVVAGGTLTITDPSKGVMANDVGIYGVAGTAPGLTLNANGTFTYTGGPNTTFGYCGNGASSPSPACAIVTVTECKGTCLAAAPTAADVFFTSNISDRYTSAPPGILGGNIANAGGLALKAAASNLSGGAVAVNDDGSFLVTKGAGAACPGFATPPSPAKVWPSGTTCVTFDYQATNTQGTPSNTAHAAVVFLPASNLAVKVYDAPSRQPGQTAAEIKDYRWIIEEDKTFWIDPKCQINTTLTRNDSRGLPCPPLPVESLGYNFHTAHMDVVAQGCVGAVSCESGQTMGGTPVACDVGNGQCRPEASGQKTEVNPGSVYLDPSKRYFLSVLPGDGENPTVGGAGGPDANGNKFEIATACGPYVLDTSLTGGSAWAPGGANAKCGHAMGGSQIAPGQTAVNISLQETPLPTAKISVFVFEDDNPLNGENDAGGGIDTLATNEPGLGGFNIELFDQAGGLGDNTGQITYDMFNQPVSNALAGKIDPITKQDACPITTRSDGAGGNFVGMIPTCPYFEADGTTPSPLAGQAIIANLYPGLYEIAAAPAASRIARGEEWLQTNTLDGGKPHEAFIKPDEPGYFQEFGPGGFHVSIGFANPKIINDRKAAVCAATPGGCNSNLIVNVANNHMSRTPDQRTFSSETYDHYSFTNCYVSVGPADAEDFAFEKCTPDGTATFSNMPGGIYKITVFDQWNDIMLDGLVSTVTVAGGGATTIKNLPVTQWRTNLFTRTFIDANGNGVPDSDEAGLALVNTNIRYRDGSFGFFNNTDLNGNAGFNEVFPFMNWLVVETSTTRYKPSSVHTVYDAGGVVDCTPNASPDVPCSSIASRIANTNVRVPLPAALRVPGSKNCDTADCLAGDKLNGLSTGAIVPPQPWGLTQGWQGLLGQNSFIEFGMKPFADNENGGIAGHVIYASTRPFDDPSLLLQLQWEPGVPRVTINLYSKSVDANGNDKLTLVDTTKTTSWDDWAQGFRKDAAGNLMKDGAGNYIPNMNCPGQDSGSPFFATLKDSKQWLDTPDASSGNKKTIANHSQFKCYDGWSQLNQVQPAPYDGMYKFPSVTAVDPATGKPAKTNCTGCTQTDADGNPMLPPGKYVVEVIVPPGYELVKEEDKNILLGDVYIAPVTQQFAGFGNIFIMPDQAAVNAAYNPNSPGGLNLTNNLGSVTFPRHEGDTGSVEAYWACVGAERIVPDLNSLYPGAGQAAPFAGAKRRLCDRKEVELQNQASVLAKFYIFSSAHIAGHFQGTMTNDFASEFDPFSPQFGEKFGPPNLPVGMRDFTGNEVGRVYADQWGLYNGLYFSTYGVNPPNPTGYVPQMSIACMNDPGPIPATNALGQMVDASGGVVTDRANALMITDPAYNPAYSNFCYETAFMPGFTAYMDTPVIPTQAFADGYNLPDTEYPNNTPAIRKVVNTDSNAPQGPWVTAAAPAQKASVALTLSQVSNGDSIGSVAAGSTTLTGGAITCDATSACSNLGGNGRNTRMASLVAASINAQTATTGFSATSNNATVTITAPVGAAFNSVPVTVTQIGINISPTPAALGGGADASVTNANLTITALGDKVVQNPNFSGPNASVEPYNQKTITRHYGFGDRPASCPATGACPNVTVGGVPMNNVSTWNDTTITGDVSPTGVPACTVQQRGQPAAQCGELVITAANGKQSIDAITVTIGGSAPWIVTPSGVTPPSGKSINDYGAKLGRMGPSPIQTAIDSASPGDLILVAPGIYHENVLMWKPIRLQGVGAASVTINADAHPAGKMDQWRRQVDCVFGLDLDGVPNLNDAKFDPAGKYSCPAAMHQRVDRIPYEAIVGWDASGNGNLAQVLQEPTVMGAYEGAGITVLGRGVRIPTNGPNRNDFWGVNATGGAGAFTDGSVYLGSSNSDCGSSTTETDGRDYGTANYFCNPARIDGVSVINSSQGGGGIFIHGWGHNLEVANTRISGNHGTLAGGINLGNGETPGAFMNDGVTCGDGAQNGGNCPPVPEDTALNAAIPFQFNTKVRLHHNMIYNNASIGDALFSGTPSGAGGITVSAGADDYKIDHNWIAGNLSTGDGGGVQHLGLSFRGNISSNYVLFNQTTNPTLPTNGGGIVIEGANLDRMINGQECGGINDNDCPPGLGEGTGPGIVLDANLILGNSAESGSGGGLRIQQVNGSEVVAFPNTLRRAPGSSQWYDVKITNNIIANNVAGWDGGGVSMQDALKVTFVNNTVASNDTTASAGSLFKTLGAINAASPPPGCTNDPNNPAVLNCPLDGIAPHGPQPAGLVVMAHTPNLLDAMKLAATAPSRLDCPSGFGYGNAPDSNNPLRNADCKLLSKPLMFNDLYWQNHSFSVDLVPPPKGSTTSGTGLQSQQNLIAITPLLNQGTTGACLAPGATSDANGAALPANFYWDIGLRTDDFGAGKTLPASTRLAMTNSIFTKDPQGVITASATNKNPTASPVVAQYCNGARMPPEHCVGSAAGIDANNPSCKGFNAPPGASETTSLAQVFVFNGIQPTATVDEGHNWLNLTFGPLTLTRPNVATATPGELMIASASVGASGGAYSVPTGSPAAGAGTVDGAPLVDFFGQKRSTTGGTAIGAVEVVVAPPTLTSISPNSGVRGSTVPVTLTGTNLTGASAVNVTRQGGNVSVACNITGTPTATTVNANCVIAQNAAAGDRNVSVTTAGGTTGTVVFTVTLPAVPTLTSISPTSGQRGSTVPVTLTGTNLTGATAVTVTRPGGGTVGVTCTISGTPTAATVTANCAIAGSAIVGSRNISVTTAGGTTGTVAFSVTSPPAPTLTGISPNSGPRPVGFNTATYNVTLTGTNLTGGTVNVGGAAIFVSNVVVVSSTTITARLTALPASFLGNPVGPHNVTVTTPGGTTAAVVFTVL